MPATLFFLGQTRELCLAELEVVAARWGQPAPTLLTPDFAVIESDSIPAAKWQEALGGVSKVASLLQRTPHMDVDKVRVTLEEILIEIAPKRFAIAEFGRDHFPPVDTSLLKRNLQNAGIRANYKDTPRYGGNAGLLKSGSVCEVSVIQLPEELVFARTLAVQDVDAWTLRDFGKPERDRKRGLLQPKVAHMMINIAMGNNKSEDLVLLDPFCGAGTILIEGAFMDIPVVLGADIDAKAAAESNTNLQWWSERQIEPFTYQIVTTPVERLEKHQFSAQPNLIVTEPFLGKLMPSPDHLANIIRGLEKMYKGMLRRFDEILPSGGRVAIIFPSYQQGKHRVTVQNTLDSLEPAGFKLVAGPFRGGREQATTQREVYILEKI